MFIRFLPYLFLCSTVLVITALSVMPAQSADTEKLTQYWITAAPWQNKDIYDVALISGASLVRENIYGVIVASNDPDFTQTAYKNGAFLVLNPIVKGSCTQKSQNTFIEI